MKRDWLVILLLMAVLFVVALNFYAFATRDTVEIQPIQPPTTQGELHA